MTAPLSLRLTAVVVGLVTAVACNSSKSPSMPDAAQPSSTASGGSAPTASSGATISGLVSNGGSATGSLMLMAAGGMSGVTVGVTGTGLTATTDGSGRFSLTGVPAGQVTLQFTGAAAGTMSLDEVAEHDTIEVEVHVHNGEVEDEQAQTGAEAQLEGKIVSVNGGGHSFVIGQITVMVPSTATIRHGDQALTFSSLISGARVHVKGSLTGSTLTATRVEVQQSGGPGPGNGNGNGGNGNGGGNGGGNGDNGNDDNDAERGRADRNGRGPWGQLSRHHVHGGRPIRHDDVEHPVRPGLRLDRQRHDGRSERHLTHPVRGRHGDASEEGKLIG